MRDARDASVMVGRSGGRSSIGKKALMAASGLILVGFVIAHLCGNLLIYAGPEALNAYAEKLRHLGPLLWVARGVLLAAVAAHGMTSIQLARENRAARPQRYAVFRPRETTYAARTMLVSGLLLAAFIVYHLLHFTFKITHPAISHAVDAMGRPHVYAMVVLSFQRPAIALVYIAGAALLGVHQSHGVASAFQTLGITHERILKTIAWIGRLLAFVLFFGYVSIPLSIRMGLVP